MELKDQFLYPNTTKQTNPLLYFMDYLAIKKFVDICAYIYNPGQCHQCHGSLILGISQPELSHTLIISHVGLYI